jgi:hypothetical protein
MLVFTIGADAISGTQFSFIFKDMRIREVEVEENIALNTLGTIIHETLKIYDPFVGDLFQNQIFKIASNKSMMSSETV